MSDDLRDARHAAAGRCRSLAEEMREAQEAVRGLIGLADNLHPWPRLIGPTKHLQSRLRLHLDTYPEVVESLETLAVEIDLMEE